MTQRLNKALRRCAELAELKARLASLMAEPMATTPEVFAEFVRRENARYERVVKQSGAKLD